MKTIAIIAVVILAASPAHAAMESSMIAAAEQGKITGLCAHELMEVKDLQRATTGGMLTAQTSSLNRAISTFRSTVEVVGL